MEYLRKLNMICLTFDELAGLYKNARLDELTPVMNKLGYSLSDVHKDPNKMQEVTDIVLKSNLQNKEDVEMFLALDMCSSFYEKGSKICFVLNDSVNPNKKQIKTLDNLKLVIKENDLTDFAIFSSSGLRSFQLKRYTEKLDTNTLFAFISRKIKGYANDLGHINLLIILQGPKTNSLDVQQMNVDFEELFEQVKTLNIKSASHILIEYNEGNKYSVLNEVYPELKSMQVEIKIGEIGRI